MTAHIDKPDDLLPSTAPPLAHESPIDRAHAVVVDSPSWPGFVLLGLALTAFLGALVIGSATQWSWAAASIAVVGVLSAWIGVRRVRRSR